MTHDTHDTTNADGQEKPGLRLIPSPAPDPNQDPAYGTPEPGDPPLSGPAEAEIPVTGDGLLAESEYGTDLEAGDVVGADGKPAGLDGDLRGPAVDGHLIELPHPGMVSRWRQADSAGAGAGAGADGADGQLPKVLPGWAKDRVIAAESARRAGRTAAHWAAFRTVRAPWDALRIVWFALVGARRLLPRLTRWAWDIDGHPLIGEVTARDDRAYVRMAGDRTIRQQWRLPLIGITAVALLVGVKAAQVWAPWWVLPSLLVAAVAGLARVGAPVGVRLVSPAVTREVRIPLTSQAIVRALSAVGNSTLSKALAESSGRDLWRSTIVAVRGGHQVHIQLPLGVLATELVPHEQRLAHALGRQADTVIVDPLPDKTPGDLMLHVRDKPALVGRRGPGPLAKARKTSWWVAVPIGVTRLGVCYALDLRGGAWFLGGQPAAGKSSLLKLAAAHTALDPYALLVVINLKGSPEYIGLKAVCHRYLSGSPETDPTIIPTSVRLLEELLSEVAARNDLLTRLVEQGKATTTDVTEELARKYPALRAMTVIIDEAHRLFDSADNPAAEATAELMARLIKACRSVGITLIAATQLAGGESVPAALVRASRIRGCLRVQDEVSFRQIFGNVGSKVFGPLGVASLPVGTVLLKAEDGAAVKVGTYHLEPVHMAEIGRKALALREGLDLLTGDALGQTLPAVAVTDPADLLRHVIRAIPTTPPLGGRGDDTVAWLAELETELSTGHPDLYADRAPGWLAAELKARSVPTPPINRKTTTTEGAPSQRTTNGVRVAAVRTALERYLTPDHDTTNGDDE